MRKCEEGQTIVGIGALDATAEGAVLRVAGRMLIKTH